MTRLKALWLRIPRKQRILINLMVIVILTLAVYVFSGCPAFTAEQKFRRAEKANFVGPGEIVGIYELENWNYEKLIVAEDAHSVTFYAFSQLPGSAEHFIYREKIGNLTVFAAPDWLQPGSNVESCEIPLFLFDEYPQAVRAELEFTLDIIYNDAHFTKDYLLESVRERNGVFRFTLTCASHGAESAAVREFSRLSGYSSSPNLKTQSVMIRLYNERDDQILAEEIIIRCVADEAHRR